jgi:hypothetical protein
MNIMCPFLKQAISLPRLKMALFWFLQSYN